MNQGRGIRLFLVGAAWQDQQLNTQTPALIVD